MSLMMIHTLLSPTTPIESRGRRSKRLVSRLAIASFGLVALALPARAAQDGAGDRGELVVADARARSLVWSDALVVLQARTGPTFERILRKSAIGQSYLAPAVRDEATAFLADIATDFGEVELAVVSKLWSRFANIDGHCIAALRHDADGFAGILVLEASTDADRANADALCNSIEEVVEHAKAERIAGLDLRVADLDPSGEEGGEGEVNAKKLKFTVPRRVRDSFVVWFGQSIEKVVASSLANPGGTTPLEDLADDVVMTSRIDAKRVLAAAALDEARRTRTGPQFGQVSRVLGLDAIEKLELAMHVVDDRLVFDARMSFFAGETNAGLLGSIYWARDAKLDEATAGLLPMEASEVTSMPIDAATCYASAIDIFVGLRGMSREEVEATLAKKLRMDVGRDFVPHIGSTYFSAPALKPQRGDAVEVNAAATDGACYGLTIRDRAKIEKGVDRILRSFALHVTRKHEVVEGVKLYNLQAYGAMRVYYAVTDAFLVVGLGDKSRTRVAEMLLRAGQGGSNAASPTTWATRLGNLAKYAPEDFQSVSIVDLVASDDELSQFAEATMAMMDEEDAAIFMGLQRVLKAVTREASRRNAGKYASVGKRSKDDFLYRLVQ